jgi:hypothetical protein
MYSQPHTTYAVYRLALRADHAMIVHPTSVRVYLDILRLDGSAAWPTERHVTVNIVQGMRKF